MMTLTMMIVLAAVMLLSSPPSSLALWRHLGRCLLLERSLRHPALLR